MPQRHKVQNWKEYNRSLKERGNIFFFVEEKMLKDKKVNNQKYSDGLIILCHQVKYLFKLGYRQTEGFLISLARRGIKDFGDVPNYSTMCRRLKGLQVKVRDKRKVKEEGSTVVIDSTGISIYNMSDWHRKLTSNERKYHGSDRYRKVHVMMDLESREVVDVEVTQAQGMGTGDCSVGKDFIERSNQKISKIIADGAYSTMALYKSCHIKGIKDVIIPPARTHIPKMIGLKCYEARNNTISIIRASKDWDTGLKEWKQNKGYHIRSRIESFMASFKRIMGKSFSAICDTRRKVEINIKFYILNAFRTFGLPISCKI